MNEFTIGDVIYHRVFPALVLLCTACGVITFASQEMSLALNCFIAVAFGIRLDNHIELRRIAQAEAAAQQGWKRLRGPIVAG